jgi:hypothetical protein
MRGDQLARQWRLIRAIEASPNGLTVAETAQREETGIRTINRDLEALQTAGFPLYTEKIDWTNRWAFIGPFKFKIPPLFTLTGLMSLYFYKELIRVLKGAPFYNSLESVFKKMQSTEINRWEMAGELCSRIATIENKHVVKNFILLRDISGDLQSNFTCVFNRSIWRT